MQMLFFPKVTRVVLLWVNNHFNDFEGDSAMTRFLEEFESNLEREVCGPSARGSVPLCVSLNDGELASSVFILNNNRK